MKNNNLDIKSLTDIKLLRMVKNDNSSEAFLEIANRHQKLFYDVCSKYSKKSHLIKYDEIIKDMYFVLNEAIRTYKQGRKTKLSTWISHFSRFYCLKKITYLTKNEFDTGLDYTALEVINLKNNKFTETKENSLKEHVLHLLDKLEDKRIKEIFKYRYYSDSSKTWNDIANKLNISAMHTINLHQKGCNFIKENFDK